MTISIRSITADEVDRFRAELLRTFGVDPDGDERAGERLRAILEPARSFAAFEGDTMIATAGSFALELSVPGGAVPMAGLTMVTVRPTHRRQGILRQLIDEHLRDAAAHGEPVSGLWASEATIYERFGYGVAAESDDLRFDATTVEVAVPGTADRIELADPTAVLGELAELFDRVRAHRPGMFRRTAPWWEHRHLFDPPDRRGGASSRRYAVARRDGVVTGWVAYRQLQKFEDNLPAGGVRIVELIASDATAEASLWRFAASVDLFPRVEYWNLPTDSALRWLTPQRRQVRTRRTDTLWLRPGDVAAALAARSYAADGELTFALRDGRTYALAVDRGAGRCAQTDAAPALRMDRSALGSILLGSTRPSLLARSGRIEGDARALAEADRLFSWPVAAWCQEIF